MVERSLLTTQYEHIGLIDRRSRRPIQSLMVRLTTDGRKMARLLRDEPLTRSKRKEVKPLSLSALRLVAYGQQHPEEAFDFHAPWGVCPLDYLVTPGTCRGLVKCRLLGGDPPTRLLRKALQASPSPLPRGVIVRKYPAGELGGAVVHTSARGPSGTRSETT
ncbi:hypothetical protein PUR23_28865 [Methylorubrum populi]|uniref:hypothetical protein n=1 Tax=Methylorubrum populi TaxID=223967 RepID=UPI0031F7460D